jgi:N-glycosylase/DNA lyase
MTNVTGISKEILDLDKTFQCGQCFRWKRQPSGAYMGMVGEMPVLLREQTFEDGTFGYRTNISSQEFKERLVTYFSLDMVYEEMINLAALDAFAKEAARFGQGIRILRQDPWEALVSFIISQRNNIPKISSTIDKLCNHLGKTVEVQLNDQSYSMKTFPTPEDILNVGLGGLQKLGLGYRDRYVYEAAKQVSGGLIRLDELCAKEVTGEHAVRSLMQLHGVGVKVAHCVALFGLGKLDMFPIDVWIQRVIDKYYPHGINIEHYGALAGLIQQYMFYYIKLTG